MPAKLRLPLAILALLVAFAAFLTPAASADRAFTQRFGQIDRGDVVMAANTLMTCPTGTSNCSTARNGNGYNDNDFTETYVDIDADATTFDSSSANLTLPAGSTVLFAGLYWGADTSAGGSGAAAPTPASKNQVKLKVPAGASYSTVTASQVDTDSVVATRYQGFADVTANVQAAGNGTYTVANVQAGTGSDRNAGWSLVVAYHDAAENVHWIGVYDGFRSLSSGQTADMVLGGFTTPASGTVKTDFGMVTYEGELGYTGDTAQLNGVNLIDAVHASGNYFNSTISNAGALVSTKSPNYINQLGFDANVMNTDGFLPNNASTATVHVGSSLDIFLPGAMTLVTDQSSSAPANTVAPTISGTAQDGQTLTANTGTWTGSPSPTFTYQWQRCDNLGANCVNVGGATGSTYLLTPTDVTKTMRVVVTGTNVVSSTSATTAQTAVVAAIPPANTALPTISGTAKDGQTLTATTGTWTGTPTITFTYQWLRCDNAGANCANIGGATASTYLQTGSDVGKTIRVTVTGSNGGGNTPATSAQTGVVAAIPPANTVLPTISGTAKDGQTLTAANGTWTGSPTINFTYQWQRCDSAGANCVAIGGATNQTYVATSTDVGKTIRVVVTGTNTGGNASASSLQTGVVVAAPPSNSMLPTITGTTVDGQTLTGSNGTWAGTPPFTYTYQWQRCDNLGANCVNIGGATNVTYVLTATDVTKTMRLVVTASGVGTASATSAQTAVVTAAPPVNTVAPTISGTAKDGQTLTATTGTWTGTPVITFAYQWQRCDSAGANCVNIGGATSSTYVQTGADVGGTIRVVVTGTNAGGSTPASSTQSGVVAPVAPANTALPTISGTAKDGQTLTAANGTWTGSPTITFTYQWLRCDSAGANCVNIGGATNSTYVATSTDIGKTVRVAVTATNAAGNASASSLQTGVVVAAPPTNSTLPTITGTTVDGQTLTGSNGTWAGTPPFTYTYQWQRCDNLGANCVNIGGATGSTYLLTPTDVTKTMRIVVTATGVGSGNATSAQSAVVTAAPPVNTALPTISGTVKDGSTLTAANGTWTGTPTIGFTYQWQRCDSAGANCVNIGGATGSTYVLTSTDVTKTIRVAVTGTNAGGNSSANSAQTVVVAPLAPGNTALPTISGTTQDTRTLTAANGTWTGTPTITFTYQWQRCDSNGCTDIGGATGSTYDLTPSDVGFKMTVVVKGTNAGGNSSATSAQTATVIALPPANTVAPTISGTARDGSTLTANKGTWTGTPTIVYSYQWRRCDLAGASCSNIAGATGSTYALVPADVDHTIRVVVTGTNAGGNASATANQTGAVAELAPDNTSAPTVSGTPRDGQTLTAGNGTWLGTPPIDFTYQWQRCDSAGANCVDVLGATGSTYDLTPVDVGSKMRVKVTGTNDAGTDTGTSPVTSVVLPMAPVNTVPPTIAGTYVDGQTLTGDKGTWTGTPTISYTYQWRRCDLTGSGCSDIAAATGATYQLVPADAGHTIRFQVTGTNAGGSASAVSAKSPLVIGIPPVNVGAPNVTGDPKNGETLAIDDGTWTGTAPFDFGYQWQRCDADGSNCVDIPGADGPTYKLTKDDEGHTVRGIVTATNSGGSDDGTSTTTGVVVPAPPTGGGEGGTGGGSTGRPTITGPPVEGQTLTSDKGNWDGAPTIDFTYQWLRCDANGDHCVEIPGATGPAYTTTSDDVGSRLRIEVTATNPDGSKSATSEDTDAIGALKTGSGDDLGSSIPDSAVSDASCQRILAGTGFKRFKAPGFGTIRVLLRAAAYVSPSLPLKVTTTTRKAKIRYGVSYTLDGKPVRTSKKTPYPISIAPAGLAGSDKHVLVSTLKASKGKAKRVITMPFRTAPCQNILSVSQWKTSKGAGLRLRVDSRKAIAGTTFAIPAALLPKMKDAGKDIGRVRIFLAGGSKLPFQLKLSKGDKGQTVLHAAGKSPQVQLTKRGAVVSQLPSGVGIVELTLYTQKKTSPKALLKKGKKARLSATLQQAAGTVKLSAVLAGRGR